MTVKEELALERKTLLEIDDTKKTDVEVLVKAEKYAKAELKSLQEILRKAKIVVTNEQALIIQEEVLNSKLDWLRSQSQPEAFDSPMSGWN